MYVIGDWENMSRLHRVTELHRVTQSYTEFATKMLKYPVLRSHTVGHGQLNASVHKPNSDLQQMYVL